MGQVDPQVEVFERHQASFRGRSALSSGIGLGVCLAIGSKRGLGLINKKERTLAYFGSLHHVRHLL